MNVKEKKKSPYGKHHQIYDVFFFFNPFTWTGPASGVAIETIRVRLCNPVVCKTTHHVEWCAEVLTDGLQSRRVHAIHGELIHRYSLTTTYRRNAKLQNIPCDLYSNQRSFPNTNAGEVKDITSYAS